MIKNKLKELMDSNNLSINKLSNETGLARPTITSLLNNESKGIQFDTLEILLKYFKVGFDDFFNVIDLDFNIIHRITGAEINEQDNNSVILHNEISGLTKDILKYDLLVSKSEIEGLVNAVSCRFIENKLAFLASFYNDITTEKYFNLIIKILEKIDSIYKLEKKPLTFEKSVMVSVKLTDHNSKYFIINVEKNNNDNIFSYNQSDKWIMWGDEIFSSRVIFGD
ncbi:helix-turn-helix domain-containing protein [Streptococcus uberis]|uniref:helix-turn-helix domain-containing protein n=1 Tax=Streptococcus uberis TaxID=1349 RepID=UPI003D77C8C1